jgi:hypothetical protein
VTALASSSGTLSSKALLIALWYYKNTGMLYKIIATDNLWMDTKLKLYFWPIYQLEYYNPHQSLVFNICNDNQSCMVRLYLPMKEIQI